jgi:hypothetical protein
VHCAATSGKISFERIVSSRTHNHRARRHADAAPVFPEKSLRRHGGLSLRRPFKEEVSVSVSSNRLEREKTQLGKTKIEPRPPRYVLGSALHQAPETPPPNNQPTPKNSNTPPPCNLEQRHPHKTLLNTTTHGTERNSRIQIKTRSGRRRRTSSADL